MTAMTILMIGTTELLLIGGIALLIFGGKKLPELMRGMGQGVRSFKQGLNEPVKDEDETQPEEVESADRAEDVGNARNAANVDSAKTAREGKGQVHATEVSAPGQVAQG